ncbi:putative bifunctional diguanylate cyclase/phosphodiesterase [Marinobacterium sediminicola]|uniref:PAS domain S-box-containing protein/diguanylate cyclase (GGDEF) domain-containing protein n=1 Tax=Marinobacterium sediminicola TaxID=518898 RepID=A0ABY1RWI3_9GAMM|nr:bifunctional diguanylate cyclase/phosphodiesterase [Marinobacterium sediminicola]ULG70298.1 EAL domain-containing protein [Marinobacterium sediminicola]SMR69806.1 PAS domain S-box-containing protein/diguanylate cyclase (GGDEF) domain-containing protein [Marinobacterium sediminicola]
MTHGLTLPTRGELQLLKEQQVILDNAGAGICFIRDRLIQRCNRQFAHIYGFENPDQLVGTSSEQLYPDSLSFRQLGVRAYPSMLRGERYTTELQMVRRDGSLFWCRITGNLISTDSPSLGSIWIIEDIDEQRRASEALHALHHEQQLILDHAMVGIAFMRLRKITRSNQRMAEMLGYQLEELSGISTRAFYPCDESWEEAGQRHREVLGRGDMFSTEIQLVRKDGSLLWCDLRSKAINPDNLDEGSIWILMDISERKAHERALLRAHEALEQRVAERTRELESVVANLHREIEERRLAEERIRHLAQHDSLTGLPNRSLFDQRLETQLQQAAATGRKLAVLFIDLDRFKHINDSLGHHEGDMLLRTLAERLRQGAGHENTLARIGGDEFVTLLNNVEPYERIEQLIHRMQNALTPPIHIGAHEFSISASIGVAIYPHDGSDIQTLIKHANTAMYRAKANGGNRYHFYNHNLDREAVERIELRNALYQALRNSEFELHYQPQVSVVEGRIVGAEALIRWNRPGKGMVSPACFIPLAEECGLINEIGKWVLENACAQLKAWQQCGLNLRVAVNLSASQLDDPCFYDQLQSCLERHDLQPEHLELELTESTLMKHVDHTVELLNRLDRLGVHLSIDDFGTGYSSLSYLKRFPLNTLKIDQSFVRDLCIDPDDAVICRTIISMAKNLNLTVTAEGVEQEAQLNKLAELGCELYQGFLFSRPIPANELTRLCQEYIPPEVGRFAI